ncbi:MAG TPA: rRNA maturation RNase YbeY [Burkholderiales bacterium]|nr:rRNA maturation RNase YbeY [Burkholderiales bacterium]
MQFAVPRRGLPSAASFRRWAAGFPGITLRIVGRKEGLFLNRKFRGKGKATNVLTFATGDVVLCHPVIRNEARQQGKSLAAHYAHLVVHGALHLQGHDHAKKKDAERMERKEVRVLRRFGFANPYE